jgi:hypothetical protein
MFNVYENEINCSMCKNSIGDVNFAEKNNNKLTFYNFKLTKVIPSVLITDDYIHNIDGVNIVNMKLDLLKYLNLLIFHCIKENKNKLIISCNLKMIRITFNIIPNLISFSDNKIIENVEAQCHKFNLLIPIEYTISNSVLMTTTDKEECDMFIIDLIENDICELFNILKLNEAQHINQINLLNETITEKGINNYYIVEINS